MLAPPLETLLTASRGMLIRDDLVEHFRTTVSATPNAAQDHIRLNTELVKKPKDLVEYVIVHEMAHLLAPTHSERFVALLDQHYPTWREARAELNELPLGPERWP